MAKMKRGLADHEDKPPPLLQVDVGGADEEKKQKGQALMLYGIIGFFVMISVWGLVRILTGSVGLNNNVPTYPVAPQTTNGRS